LIISLKIPGARAKIIAAFANAGTSLLLGFVELLRQIQMEANAAYIAAPVVLTTSTGRAVGDEELIITPKFPISAALSPIHKTENRYNQPNQF
jgi:hypothetical protein